MVCQHFFRPQNGVITTFGLVFQDLKATVTVDDTVSHAVKRQTFIPLEKITWTVRFDVIFSPQLPLHLSRNHRIKRRKKEHIKRSGSKLGSNSVCCVCVSVGVCFNLPGVPDGWGFWKIRGQCKCQALRQSQESNRKIHFGSFAVTTHDLSWCRILPSSAAPSRFQNVKNNLIKGMWPRCVWETWVGRKTW